MTTKPTSGRFLASCLIGLTISSASHAASRGDFDGDNRSDLVIGIIREDVNGQADAGAVQVIYGANAGLTASGSQIWHQDQPGMNNTAQAGDSFGAAIAAGDFNGDGFDDLAIGIPGEDISGQGNAGAVQVLYGSSNGLRSNGDQFWHQDSSGVNEVAEADDNFGAALAAGDFNHDGFDDLAIGVPGEDVGFISDAGAVSVLYGSSAKLRMNGDQVWHQDSDGINGACNDGDAFGSALVVGNFNGDAFDDLAIGVPGEDINGQFDAGAVNIIYGSSSKLRKNKDQYWNQDSEGINDVAEAGDSFGLHLAAGDFNDDGRDDLAIASPFEDLDANIDAGAVAVLYGHSTGLRHNADQVWHQDVAGIADVAEADDRFGNAITAGDFDGDGFDDLAIGVEKEDINIKDDAGAFHIIFGGSSRLSASGDEFWNQDSPGLLETNENFDNVARALACGDYDNDGFTDLAVAIPSEDTGGVIDSGAVMVVYGKSSGLSTGGEQLWHQNCDGVPDSCQTEDFFGDTLGQ